MPLNISPELETHIGQTTTTLATCIDIILADGSGVEYHFTDHDKEIDFGGNTYLPTSGYIPSASNTKIDLSVDNLKIIGILNEQDIKQEDLLAGRFDYASVKIFQVNYKDLTMGNLVLINGKVGKITVEDNNFIMELRGLTQFFQQSIGRPYIVHCDADLGDSRCTYNIVGDQITFTVTNLPDASAENRIFESDITAANSFYDLGLVVWQSGTRNQFFRMDVKNFVDVNGKVELYEPMPFDILVGDTGIIQPGCDKTWDTCKNRYNNQLNYRGFPHLYGLLTALRGER